MELRTLLLHGSPLCRVLSMSSELFLSWRRVYPLHFAAPPRSLARGVFYGAGLGTLLQSLLWAGKVGLAVANLIFAGHLDFDLPIGVCGASRGGVIPQPVLRTQLAVDAIENTVQFAGGVREEHSPTHGIGNCFQGVFAGRVAAAFVFDRANDDGVKQRSGAHRLFSGGVEIGSAGRFAGVSNQDHHSAAIFTAALQVARGQQDGVIYRSASVSWHAAHSGLQGSHIV